MPDPVADFLDTLDPPKKAASRDPVADFLSTYEKEAVRPVEEKPPVLSGFKMPEDRQPVDPSRYYSAARGPDPRYTTKSEPDSPVKSLFTALTGSSVMGGLAEVGAVGTRGILGVLNNVGRNAMDTMHGGKRMASGDAFLESRRESPVPADLRRDTYQGSAIQRDPVGSYVGREGTDAFRATTGKEGNVAEKIGEGVGTAAQLAVPFIKGKGGKVGVPAEEVPKGEPYTGPDRRGSVRDEFRSAFTDAQHDYLRRSGVEPGQYDKATPEQKAAAFDEGLKAQAKYVEKMEPGPLKDEAKKAMGPVFSKSERGAVSGTPVKPAESSKIRDLVESASQAQLQNTRRASPEAQQGALTSLNAPADSKVLARGLVSRIKDALGDMPVEQYHDALHELNVMKRGKGMSVVGLNGSTLPDMQAFVDTIQDPRFQEAFRIDSTTTNSLARPWYKAAGGKSIKGGDPTIGGFTGHHSFLPLGEEDVAALAGKRIITPAGIVEGKGALPPTSESFGGLSKVANPKAQTAKQYKGTAPGYEGDLQTVRERQFADAMKAGGRKVYERGMVRSGNAWWSADKIPAGVEADSIDVMPFNPTDAPRSIWVKRGPLSKEARKIVGAEVAPNDVGSAIGDALTMYNIFGNPAELGAHIAGVQKAAQGAPTDFLHPYAEAIANFIPGVGGRIPVVGRFIPGGGTALGTMKFVRALKTIMDPPAEELMSLASEVPGVLRRSYGGGKFLGSETAGKVVNVGSQVIDKVWDGASVYFGRVYDNAVKSGAAYSVDGKRRYILQQLGNFLTPTQGTPMRTLKAYQNRFAVTATTRFTRGVKSMLGITGLPGGLKQAALGVSAVVGPILGAMASWYMATGKPPPKDVPKGGAFPGFDASGKIKKDEAGGTEYEDVMDQSFLRRGAKNLGLDAADKASRGGLSADQIAGAGLKQAGQRLEGLTVGPTTSFIHGVATGEDPAGNRIAPFVSSDKDPRASQFGANLVYTLKHGNPVGEGGFGMATGTDTGLSRLIERFTPGKAGPGVDYMDRLKQIRGKQDYKAFMQHAYEEIGRAKPSEKAAVRERLAKEREALIERLKAGK